MSPVSAVMLPVPFDFLLLTSSTLPGGSPHERREALPVSALATVCVQRRFRNCDAEGKHGINSAQKNTVAPLFLLFLFSSSTIQTSGALVLQGSLFIPFYLLYSSFKLPNSPYLNPSPLRTHYEYRHCHFAIYLYGFAPSDNWAHWYELMNSGTHIYR